MPFVNVPIYTPKITSKIDVLPFVSLGFSIVKHSGWYLSRVLRFTFSKCKDSSNT